MFGDKSLQILDADLQDRLRSELQDQGHTLTGALEASIDSVRSGSALDIVAADYIGPVSDGVKPSRIPYDSSKRTGAGTSQYIQGLVQYAKLRMGATSDAEALRIAFAIARKHEKEGMPTRNSYQYSSNGKRTRALEEAFDDPIVDDRFTASLSHELDHLLEMNKTVNI